MLETFFLANLLY